MKNFYSLFISAGLLFSVTLHSQCTTTTVVPYYESFNGISNTNQLPTCWAASNIGNTCFTYTTTLNQGRQPRTGTQYASFYYSPSGVNYFYSNGIQLNAGVAYSVSVWYTTEFYGYTNWSDLSILLGSSQSPSSLVSLVSTNGPAVSSGIYASLSNTFTVANSGIYYVAIRGTSGSSTGAQYLTIDDLSISVACNSAPNYPLITLVASSTAVCAGTPANSVTFTATSPNTHSWSTGATGTVTTFTTNVFSSGSVSVIGTNTLSGCLNTASIYIPVNPSPNVIIYTSQPNVCVGQSATLTAFGANSTTWSTGQQTNSIVVSPTVNTTYSVITTNSFGCSSSAVQAISVNPLPVLNIHSAVVSNTICEGESDTLTVSGASTYIWTFGQTPMNGSQIIVSPLLSTTYTVTGTAVNGCSSQTSFVLSVNGCTGINQLNNKVAEIKIFPNPFQDELVLTMGIKGEKLIEITDLSGRTILSIHSKEEEIIVNTKYYANGVYYVKVISENGTGRLKVIKN